MSDDLLAREKEFHKLNQKLQLKTHDVIKEINSITYASTSNESFNNIRQLHTNFAVKNINAAYPADETLNTDKQPRKLSLEDIEILSIGNVANTEVLSKESSNLGNKAIIKLLKGKIDMLHKKLETIKHEYNKKVNRNVTINKTFPNL